VAALPGNDNTLENLFSAQDYLDVDTADNTRVAQSAFSEYTIFLFKDYIGASSTFTVTWEGQSSLAPSLSVVVLQVYNRNSTTWETLDSDNAAAANTDFELTGSVLANVANYKDASNVVSCRVYQLAQ
jgi:hypothetical protein